MRPSRLLVAAAAIVASLPSGATAAPASLTPQALDLTMRAGQSRTVDYRLQLAAWQPGLTDVYFLVDTSASMQPGLADLRRGLVNAIGGLHGRDVRVGLGEFRTTSAADWSEGVTYRALRRAGAIDQRLARAVDELGRDQAPLSQVVPGRHAHTVALDEAVSGNGYWPYVGPGMDAGFRQGTRRVVVVVTDSPFAADSSQPTRDEAIETLRSSDVVVFGLALHRNALGDLTALAAGTRSVTDTTVDCGSGRRVAAGRPAACLVSPSAIGRAVNGMLYVHRGSRVTASAIGTGVRRLAPQAWTINPNHHSQMAMRLTVACAADDAGRTHVIGLTVSQAGERIAAASVTLRCVR